MAKDTGVRALRDIVRGRGLRATPSRLAVLEVVRASATPLTHGEVADRLRAQAWDRATIYRNLIDLAEVNLLRRTDVGDHTWRFEAVGGEHDAGHPHFVCTECGTIACLPGLELSLTRPDTRARARVPRRRSRPPRAVRQRRVEVHVRGLCDACL